jgi:hypothetical protein
MTSEAIVFATPRPSVLSRQANTQYPVHEAMFLNPATHRRQNTTKQKLAKHTDFFSVIKILQKI